MTVAYVPSTRASTHLGRFRHPVIAEGETLLGVPFRSRAILALYPNARMYVQAAFGADLTADPDTWEWTDVTERVRQNDGNIVSISPIGRSDAVSAAQPAGCSFVLDNTWGEFTAYHPLSPYYPYVRRNTPIRVLVNMTGNVSDTSTRFFGYANGWVPGWEVTNAENVAIVSVSASGITRRLTQGKAVVSPLRGYVTDTVNSSFGVVHKLPSFYWPLEDGANALLATSAVDGVPPLIAPSFEARPQFAGRQVGNGSLPIAVFNTGDSLSAVVSVSGPNIRIPFLMNLPAFPAANTVLMRVYCTGSVVFFDISLEPATSSFVIRGYNQAAVEVLGVAAVDNSGILNQTTWVSLELNQNGANIDFGLNYSNWFITEDGASTPFVVLANSSIAGTLGQVTRVTISPGLDVNDVAIGHLAAYEANGATGLPSVFGSTAIEGYAGEYLPGRTSRVTGLAGIPFSLVGSTDQFMGAQPIDTVVNVLRDCESTEGGVLYDGLNDGLTYVTMDARMNLTPTLTVDVEGAQLGVPFTPVDNDQRDRNKITAKRKLGGDATFEDVTGPRGTANIGTYDSDVNVNPLSEANLVDYASWAVHLGTIDGFRYTSIQLDFIAVPALATSWLNVTPTSIVRCTYPRRVFNQHPPGDVDLVVEGWSEQISPWIWNATLNTSLAKPWTVGTLDDSGFLDCGASTTTSELSGDATTITLLIRDSCAWAHDNGDYVIVINGEEMTVTAVGAVTGTAPARNQTLTVTRATNGISRTHRAGSEVHVRDGITLTPSQIVTF